MTVLPFAPATESSLRLRAGSPSSAVLRSRRDLSSSTYQEGSGELVPDQRFQAWPAAGCWDGRQPSGGDLEEQG